MSFPALLFSQPGDALEGWFELFDTAVGEHKYNLLDPTRILTDDSRVCMCREGFEPDKVKKDPCRTGLFVRRGDLVAVVELGPEWSLVRCAQTEVRVCARVGIFAATISYLLAFRGRYR